jgi:hypothetical protein
MQALTGYYKEVKPMNHQPRAIVLRMARSAIRANPSPAAAARFFTGLLSARSPEIVSASSGSSPAMAAKPG